MITILHGGGVSRDPKSDYVICARPLDENTNKISLFRVILLLLLEKMS